MSNLLVALGLFGVSFLASDLILPLARRLATRFVIVDRPGGRKQHAGEIPLLGGVPIVLTTIGVSAVYLTVASRTAGNSRLLLAVGAGAVLTHILGLWDDGRALRARYKLAIQFLITAGVVGAGLRIGSLETPSASIPLGFAAIPLTTLWIVVITNAWNLIDGIDGLAAGASALAAGTLAIIMAAHGWGPSVPILVCLAGASVGFLKHNFHPASIFMGDGGSLFIGFLLATLPLLPSGPERSAMPLDARIPLLVCLVPLGDLVAAVIRRFRLAQRTRREWGTSIAGSILKIGLPDRRHLHHAVNRRIPSTRRTVWLLLALSTFTCGAAILAAVRVLAWPLLLAVPSGIAILLARMGCLGATRTEPRAHPVATAEWAGRTPETATVIPAGEIRRAA